jgi:hypothetical protein
MIDLRISFRNLGVPLSSEPKRTLKCVRANLGALETQVRFKELDISLWRFVLLSTVLFSIFCYRLELERLGRALLERKDRS